MQAPRRGVAEARPRGGGFEAATADMVRKRLKIVLAVRFRAEQLRKVKNDVKTSGEVPLRLYRDAYSKSRIARRFARESLSPLEQAGLKCQKSRKRARSLTLSHGDNRSPSPVAAVVHETSPNARKFP